MLDSGTPRQMRSTLRTARVFMVATLLVAAPTQAQEAPFVSAGAEDGASQQIQVAQPGTLHIVLRGRTAPGDVPRVYWPDGTLVGEATADGVEDLALYVAMPAAGTYLARDERPALVPDAAPAALSVDFTGRASADDGASQPPADRVADSGDDEPANLPGYAPGGSPTLSLAGLDPAPGTQLRRPACDLIRLLGPATGCPPGRSAIGADVTADFAPGPVLVVIALVDRDSTPAVPAPDPDGGLGGQDARTAIAYLTNPGTVHLTTSTVPLYIGTVPQATRLRVRLCEFPHAIDGIFQLGPCHAEVASDPYRVAPAPSGSWPVQPPDSR